MNTEKPGKFGGVYAFASPVLRWFVSPEPPCGENFVKKVIPVEWQPQLLFAEPIRTPVIDLSYEDRHFTAHAIVNLSQFRFGEWFDPKETNDPLERAKALRETFSGWIKLIPQVNSWDGTVCVGPRSAFWHFMYAVNSSEGCYNVWIVPSNVGSATMIAEVTEWVSSKASRKGV